MSVVSQVIAAFSTELSESDLLELVKAPLNIIELFRKNGKFDDERFMVLAAQHGQVEAIAIIARGNKIPPKVALAANETVVRWLFDNYNKCCISLDDAIAADNAPLVNAMLKKQQMTWNDQHTVFALKKGAYKVLESIRSKDGFKDLKASTLVHSHESDNTTDIPDEVRKWVEVNGEPTPRTANEVAARGRLDVLKHFFPDAKGCGMKTWTAAVLNQHIDIMHWLVQTRPECPDFSQDRLIRMAHKLNRQDILDEYE